MTDNSSYLHKTSLLTTLPKTKKIASIICNFTIITVQSLFGHSAKNFSFFISVIQVK